MIKKVFKIRVIAIILFVCLFKGYSQTDNNDDFKEVESIAKKMFVDMNNRDYDAIIDMMHPNVFEMVPKETLKTLFKSALEGNEAYSIELPTSIPEYKVSKIFKSEEENLEYSFVSYEMDMKMTFNNEEFDEEAKEMMIPMMKAQGMDVEFISNNTMSVSMKDRMTVIMKDDSTDNTWVMINYDPDSPLFYQIVPSSLIETAKEYKQNLMLESKKKRE
ncbi:hypothetical protein L3X39_05645 [Sabulilitoribacter multivorans]|uniref:Uncharacterized protein n=1 Tax=Flaviramulus multivorans TaxID=1304750 RepID=A0ABS9IHK2_9FLAO|nr:hypothetical protein [Flaviramulus multivorans]MCF7560115.1 hypothetical protein [Flaviramulus multivorans]